MRRHVSSTRRTMNNGDAMVDNERRPVALASMPAIVAYLIALFPQEGCNFPPSPAHRAHSGRRVSPKPDRPNTPDL